MADLRTCPFCNTLLPETVGGVRPTCPRCGEVPVSSRHDGEPRSAALPTGQVTAESKPRRWLIVAAALAVLAVGLVIAWPYLGRSGTSEQSVETIPAVVAPADLPGLGYLHGSTEAIFTIQMPSFLEKLGPEYRDNPVKALADIGIPDYVIKTIDKASGVGLKNVDQLVVGASFEKGSFPPQIVVVVHTRQPYDIAALVREADARARRVMVARSTRPKRPRFQACIGGGPMTAYWWRRSKRVTSPMFLCSRGPALIT